MVIFRQASPAVKMLLMATMLVIPPLSVSDNVEGGLQPIIASFKPIAPPEDLNAHLFNEPDTSTTAEQLPELGDRVSAISSPEQEHTLGRAWLRSLRRQASLIQDPLLHDYLENLTYRLASYSDMQSPKLELVIVNSESVNAFAVPGGVVGVNAGLFIHAESEDELASVLAHELAHLSQRHFARNVENAHRTQLAGLAALLASVALIATSNGDPGLAALATTQALAVQNQLRYSREHEREADRIGMTALARAGMDPNAMPRFFEKMHNITRYSGELPPEFLLTHPVTQSRISDSRNRAAQHSTRYNYAVTASANASKNASLEFELMKSRVLAAYNNDTIANIKRFKSAMSQQHGKGRAANRYGLVRALLKANQYQEAMNTLKPLREQSPNRITYVITESEILMAENRYQEAATLLAHHLSLNPENYPLSIYYAQNLLRIDQPDKAIPILESQMIKKPDNTHLWRLLSEAYGATGNIIAVHQARAELFFLHNQTERAVQQLKYALTLSEENFQLTSRIHFRIKEMNDLNKKLRVR